MCPRSVVCVGSPGSVLVAARRVSLCLKGSVGEVEQAVSKNAARHPARIRLTDMRRSGKGGKGLRAVEDCSRSRSAATHPQHETFVR